MKIVTSVNIKNLKFGFVLLFFSMIFFNAQSQESDTLIVKFKNEVVNNFVYINKIDVFGKEVKKKKSTDIHFLFTNQKLKNKLDIKNERDNKFKYIGYSSGPPQFGIELNYYQKDSLEIRSYNKTKNYFLSIVKDLKENGAKEERILNFKNDVFKTLEPPLIQLYADESFLKNKTIFEFTGSEKNYKTFKRQIDNHEIIFVLMPYNISGVMNFDYHFVQVNERYIKPGL